MNWKLKPPSDVVRAPPPNKLSEAEKAEILAVLDSSEVVDSSSLQIRAKLLDQGQYFASVSTFYRVSNQNHQVGERRRLTRYKPHAIPHLEVSGPNP